MRNQRLAVVGAILLAAALLGWGARGVALAQEEPPPEEEEVTVEAYGFAALPEGRPLQEAHQEALLDARRNVLLQGHVSLEAGTIVRNMRLGEATIGSWARGQVRRADVLEAGPVEVDGARSYRVHLRAMVTPLPPGVGGAPGEDAAGRPWQPVVKFAVHAELPDQDQAQLAAALIMALQRCGIGIVPGEASRPALVLRVAVTRLEDERATGTRVVYHAGYDAPPPGATAVAPATGHWLLAGPADREEWWQRLAAVMAQDVLRLWGTPRPTALRFRGLTPKAARDLAATAERTPGARVRADDGTEVVVILPVAGDPRPVAEQMLREAGVEEPPTPAQVSLTQLTYAFDAAGAAAAGQPEE